MAATQLPAPVAEDQHVVLHDVTWQDFETLLAMRGDHAGVRMFYLDGEIELMSPTKDHEGRKKMLARLLEAWALETGVALEGFGSWALKSKSLAAGGEPDECYLIGDRTREVPDLVLEVEWSRAIGLAKHEIYRRLGVRELWTLARDGRLTVRVLDGGQWAERSASALLPTLDVNWLASLLERGSQTDALLALRDRLRGATR